MRVLAVLAAVAIVASAAKWEVKYKDLDTTDIGVCFADANTGYAAGDANGVGATVFKTTDGATTFTQANFSGGFLLLDCDASGDSVVVSSILGEYYSQDGGKTFAKSFGGGLSQNVRHIGEAENGAAKYGCAGTFFGKDGVALSDNGGITFKAYDAGLPQDAPARYASFPTDKVWYVAGGQWPAAPPPPPPPASMLVKSKSQPASRKGVHFDAHGRYTGVNFAMQKKSNLGTVGYTAQIAKTTDGGATWSQVYSDNGTFYFNAIDCNPSDPNNCCAVGEGAEDSPDPGARILCTTDGGSTWTKNFEQKYTGNEGFSLMEVQFTSAKTVHACGGVLHSAFPDSWFLRSDDAGVTWTNTTLRTPGLYCLGLNMVSDELGYAAIDNLITQASDIAKYE